MSITASGVENFGKRYFYNYNGAPRTIATTAVTVSGNVATATVSGNIDIPVGALIYTTGLTANVLQADPVVVTASTPTAISFALTAADGSMADGVGDIIPYDYQILLDERIEQFQILNITDPSGSQELRGVYKLKSPSGAVLVGWLNELMRGVTGVAPA